MPMAKITPAGEHGLYHVHFLDGRTDPGFGHGGAEHPDHGLPGGAHPDNELPGRRPPHVGGGPAHPPAIPGNELPDHPPPTLMPGYTLVMVRGPGGRWEYAFIAPGSPPPKPLPPGQPERPNRPGNELPGQGRPPQVGGGPVEPRPPHIGGGPATPPVRPENPIAPTPEPK